MPIKPLSKKEQKMTPENKNFSLKSKNGAAIKRDAMPKKKKMKKMNVKRMKKGC